MGSVFAKLCANLPVYTGRTCTYLASLHLREPCLLLFTYQMIEGMAWFLPASFWQPPHVGLPQSHCRPVLRLIKGQVLA